MKKFEKLPTSRITFKRAEWLKEGLVSNSMKVIEALLHHPIRKNEDVEKALAD